MGGMFIYSMIKISDITICQPNIQPVPLKFPSLNALNILII